MRGPRRLVFTRLKPKPRARRRIEAGLRRRQQLVEFKHRDKRRAYLSDVVELSAQRHVLQLAGHVVSRRGFVVVILPNGTRSQSLAVHLEEEGQVLARSSSVFRGWWSSWSGERLHAMQRDRPFARVVDIGPHVGGRVLAHANVDSC